MLADIASGETDTADVLFLCAAFLFGFACVAHFLNDRAQAFAAPLIAAGLTLTALAFLVL